MTVTKHLFGPCPVQGWLCHIFQVPVRTDLSNIKLSRSPLPSRELSSQLPSAMSLLWPCRDSGA